ncbi:MAG: SsrA-binding protein [Deltaproteobacteria bacterium RIFOXYA12_FULL_61_11]|nr:MAG: SsrA-binding protein [Deltaproteobacteria bacterium RIFOXYA12_FULL_61_11]
MDGVICTNRKARHDYFIEGSFEAGIVLTGTEVKSLRSGRANLRDAYAKVEGGELWLCNCHIDEYEFGNRFNHNPLRERKLLMHHREIIKLEVKTRERGFTIIPLSMYFKKGRVKLELGLAHGKRKYDKRQALKQEEVKRELAKIQRQRW